jgi:hypothetical protein
LADDALCLCYEALVADFWCICSTGECAANCLGQHCRSAVRAVCCDVLYHGVPSWCLVVCYAVLCCGAGGARPVVLRGVLDSWPALTKWQDMAYLCKVGHTLVGHTVMGHTVVVRTCVGHTVMVAR